MCAAGVSIFADSTLNGSESLLPPQTELGAKARTDASVSILLLRLFEEDARVTMLALSVNVLLAAVLRASDTWRGMADAVKLDEAGEIGYWWEKRVDCGTV